MKKTVLFFVAAAFIITLGGFVQAQDQTPPPPKPVVTTAVPTSPMPPAQAVPHPAKPVPTPHKAPVAATSPSAAVPHPAPGLTPHPIATTLAPPAAIAQATPPAPTAPATAEAAIPHPADIAVTPHPSTPVAAVPAMIAPTVMSVPAAPVAATIEQTPPPKAAVAHEAQAATKPKQPAPTPHPPAEMRTEIIKFNFLDAITVHSLLFNYRSPNGRVSNIMDRAAKSIVVTDTPEIVEKMISIVKEIDIKPVEIQFTVQLIQGTEAEGPGDESLKNDPVIRELRSVLKYKSFALLDGTIMRVIDGNVADTKFGPKGEYAIRLEPKYVKEGATETIQTKIQLRKPEWISQRTTKQETKEETQSMQMYYNELIGTTLQLKVGEKAVVGVSKSDADKGLILILSAKVIK